jgi:hypothetical protein
LISSSPLPEKHIRANGIKVTNLIELIEKMSIQKMSSLWVNECSYHHAEFSESITGSYIASITEEHQDA